MRVVRERERVTGVREGVRGILLEGWSGMFAFGRTGCQLSGWGAAKGQLNSQSSMHSTGCELTGKLILLRGCLAFLSFAHDLGDILTIIFFSSLLIKVKTYNVLDYQISVYKCMHSPLWWYLEILRNTSGRI